MKIFDCATPLTAQTAAQFKAAGYDAVCRYLVPTTYAKALTKEEADIISAAGLKIISVYETTADRALSDYAGGVADAKTVMSLAQTVGQPTGSTVYFPVDFEASSDQLSGPIAGYFSGTHDALAGYDNGAYGDYDACVFLKGKGLVTHTWQCYAWSGHQLSECNVYQYLNGPNGADYDEDMGFGFEGAWTTGAAPANTAAAPTTTLDPGVAQTVINSWIIPDWKKAHDTFVATNNDAYQKQAVYYHWIANTLRAAAGLPLEDDK